MERLRLAGAQINTVVGDLGGNVERVLGAYRRAQDAGAHLAVFPELAVTGYPPEDLVFKPSFLSASADAVRAVAAETGETAAAVGFVEPTSAGPANAAALCHRGEILAVYRKVLLPNYSVFDEARYFVAGRETLLAAFGGVQVAVTICEDLWFPWGPLHAAADAGAEVVISLNGSPYRLTKEQRVGPMLATRAADYGVHLFWVNLVGGQDELVFEGGSRHISPEGQIVRSAATFTEELLLADLDLAEGATARLADRPRHALGLDAVDQADELKQHGLMSRLPGEHDPAGALGVRRVRVMESLPRREGTAETAPARLAHQRDPEDEVYQALVLATRDYVDKNGFPSVVIALSGGIDSSLVAAVAVDALGADRVLGVAMPSAYSSAGSVDDARALADALGIRLLVLPIAEAFQALLDTLKEPFAGTEVGVAEENLQARVRGNLVMALSNKRGSLVLTTGNKSELAVGYATLYGDMAGGFAVIRDVPKMLVYRLARWRNEQSPVIPEPVLTKAPSAELRPGQLDVDSLPPYEVLDPIVEAYVEQDASAEELVARGHDRAAVQRVVNLVDGSEYKRRQAAPGPKITGRAFGKDRRLPITNRFRGTASLG